MADKIFKIVFGDPHPGNIRVMYGGEELPNVCDVQVKSTKPGEIPKIQIEVLTPSLVVEDHTPEEVGEMKPAVLNATDVRKSKSSKKKSPATVTE